MTNINVKFNGPQEAAVLRRLKELKARYGAHGWADFFRIVVNRLDRVKGGSEAGRKA